VSVPTATAEVRVAGFCEPALSPVAGALARAVAEHPERGAAIAVYRDGVPVVDLRAGASYERDPRQLVFSAAKAVTAVAAQIAAERGELDLDQPVAEYWPAFRRAATRTITARTVLAHRAGLPAVDGPITVADVVGTGLEEALERQEPYWEPGSAHGYHTITFGTLVDGILRRAVGSTVAEYTIRHLTAPLGLSLAFGEADAPDVAPVVSRGEAEIAMAASGVTPGGPLLDAAGFGLLTDPTVFNSGPLAGADLPAVGLVAHARDLARLLAATCGEVDGMRVLGPAGLAQLRRPYSVGIDRVSGEPSRFGAGVALPSPRLPFLGPGSFGHDGHGGCLVAAHPETATTVAFTTDALPRVGGASTGASALMATVRHCLEGSG
jgi:CubicO group peptidase (beta-lactamase class C family)